MNKLIGLCRYNYTYDTDYILTELWAHVSSYPSFALCDYKEGFARKKMCGRGDDNDVVEDIVSPFCNQLLRRDLPHC